jgi:16S rRNA (guanine527-N7)-methyltransferase
VNPALISELLQPFQVALNHIQLDQISTYIDLLLHWNARINLTAIRKPEDIVTRHFGESLFAAQRLFPIGAGARPSPVPAGLIDVGSGPGFPGLPIKIWNPSCQLTLIESNHKKATFLREAVRALTLTDINVLSVRAETHAPASADVVTLRAVERFEHALPAAARLVAAGGRLALLIGSSQVAPAAQVTLDFAWNPLIPIPGSSARILLVGTAPPSQGGPRG